MKKILLILLLCLILTVFVFAADWITPTGHDDVDGNWSSDGNCYDDVEASYSVNTLQDADTYEGFMELSINSMDCDKVRFMARQSGTILTVDCDVFYNAGWHDHYEDNTFSNQTWFEVPLGGTFAVTVLRIRMKATIGGTSSRLHEVDFGVPTVFPIAKFGGVAITKWNNIEITVWNTIE